MNYEQLINVIPMGPTIFIGLVAVMWLYVFLTRKSKWYWTLLRIAIVLPLTVVFLLYATWV